MILYDVLPGVERSAGPPRAQRETSESWAKNLGGLSPRISGFLLGAFGATRAPHEQTSSKGCSAAFSARRNLLPLLKLCTTLCFSRKPFGILLRSAIVIQSTGTIGRRPPETAAENYLPIAWQQRSLAADSLPTKSLQLRGGSRLVRSGS